MPARVAETCRTHAMFLIQDTLKLLYAFVGSFTISNQLNAWSWANKTLGSLH